MTTQTHSVLAAAAVALFLMLSGSPSPAQDPPDDAGAEDSAESESDDDDQRIRLEGPPEGCRAGWTMKNWFNPDENGERTDLEECYPILTDFEAGMASDYDGKGDDKTTGSTPSTKTRKGYLRPLDKCPEGELGWIYIGPDGNRCMDCPCINRDEADIIFRDDSEECADQSASASNSDDGPTRSEQDNDDEQEDLELHLEGMAYCWPSDDASVSAVHDEEWRCHGPTQRTSLYDSTVEVALDYAGCDDAELSERMRFRDGWLLYCNEKLESYDHDIVDKYDVPANIADGRHEWRCPTLGTCKVKRGR